MSVKNASDIMDGGVINNGTLAKVMRNAIETKALLQEKGSIYVGTGTTNQIVVQTSENETDTYNIPVTKAIVPLKVSGQSSTIDEGQVLVASDVEGIKWRKIQSVAFIQTSNWSNSTTAYQSYGKYQCTISLSELFPGETDWNDIVDSIEVYRDIAIGLKTIAEKVSLPTLVNESDSSIQLYSNVTFSGSVIITLVVSNT